MTHADPHPAPDTATSPAMTGERLAELRRLHEADRSIAEHYAAQGGFAAAIFESAPALLTLAEASQSRPASSASAETREKVAWEEIANARAETIRALARERDILIKLHRDLIDLSGMRDHTADDFLTWMGLTAKAAANRFEDALASTGGGERPIPMVLHCPKCGLQHIDGVEHTGLSSIGADVPLWTNPPHRSHLCRDCGHIWRPADVPTEGVAAVQTKGRADCPITSTPDHRPTEAQVDVGALVEALEGAHVLNAARSPTSRTASDVTIRYSGEGNEDRAFALTDTLRAFAKLSNSEGGR